MGKAILRYRYYEFFCKTVGRTSKWFQFLGKYIRAPRERMRFVMIPVEKRLDAPRQQLLSMDVVDALVDRAGGTAVIHQCMCRVGGHCRDYPREIGCLVLGDAVKDLDPRIGRIVGKDEARAHIRRGLDAGLYPLISHYERDAMMFSLDFDRILIVCFCCPCHCVARNAGRESEGLDNSFYSNAEKFPMVQITLDADKCKGCGKCERQCFARAITMADGKAVLDADKCKGCGHCAYICGAYRVSYDLSGVDAVIEALDFKSDIG